MDEKYVSEIVASVVKSMTSQTTSTKKQKGVFPTMTEDLNKDINNIPEEVQNLFNNKDISSNISDDDLPF